MERVKVTTDGQITLPKSMRDKLGVGEGGYLEAFFRGNELVFRHLPDKTGKETLAAYCRLHSTARIELDEARHILERAPFSLSERVRILREQD